MDSSFQSLSRCYNDHAGLSIDERYMSGQHELPHKLRFKSATILELFQVIFDGAQPLYKNNRDFLSLSEDDRSILLHSTLTHTGSISGNFILYKIQLMDHPAYYDALQLISSAHLVSLARRTAPRLNFDMIIMKLLLAILSFSTLRYLLYKSNHEQAVKCFSDFIRCIFMVNESIVEAQNLQWFTDIIDFTTEKTEHIVSLKD